MSNPSVGLFRFGNDVLKHPHCMVLGPMRKGGPVARTQPKVDSGGGCLRQWLAACLGADLWLSATPICWICGLELLLAATSR